MKAPQVEYHKETVTHDIFKGINVRNWNGFRDYALTQDREDDSGILEYHKCMDDIHSREFIISTESDDPFHIWAAFYMDVGETSGTLVLADYVVTYLLSKDEGMLDWPQIKPSMWTAEGLAMDLAQVISDAYYK